MTTTFSARVQPSQPNTVLAIVLTGYLMIVLDLSIIFTGLPEIGQSMGLGPVPLSWVHNAYLLSFGGFLLLAARLGDLLGRKFMLQTGIAVFSLASLCIGAATTPGFLIAARAVQGLGAAILAPSIVALISVTFAEGEDRSRALAWYSIVAGAGSSLGLVLGGVFAGLLSWRVGFLVNVPIGLVLWLAAARNIPETERSEGRIDIIGAISSTIGMVTLVFGIVNSAKAGWAEVSTLAPVGVAVLILAGFLVWESRAPAPLLPLRLFTSRIRSTAYISRMLFIGPMIAFFYFTTQLMQTALGYSPVQAGFGFLPMTGFTFVAALALPRLIRRYGQSGVLAAAFVCLTVGLLWLAYETTADASYWRDLALPMALIGIGNGGGLAPLTSLGVTDVQGRDQGAASGLVNAAHQLGGSLGLGVLVVVFAAANAPDLTGADALAHRIGAVMIGGALFCALGLVLTLAFIRPAERTAERRRDTR